MKILDLKLENFQGIKSAEFDFGGQSAEIFGDNATGKTTVFNAVTWLLFNCSSTGAKNYTPKTKGADGDIHYLEHSAAARFCMEDGRIITLKKVFHENYKKKRGSVTEEFSGHKVDFYIDGVPIKEKEYNGIFASLCGGSEQMKMLTMPGYFAETMSMEDRRRILLEICGDVSDRDVIDSHSELAELERYLLVPGTVSQKYTVEEYKKIAAAQKSDINKQLQGIPERIDEAERAIPDAQGIDVGDIETKLSDIQKSIDALNGEKAGIMSGNTAFSDAGAAEAEAVERLAKARAAYAEKAAKDNEETQTVITVIQQKINTANRQKSESEEESERIEKNIKRLTEHRKELLDKYSAIRAEKWDESQAVCPVCRRELPKEQAEQMRSDFMLNRSRRLQEINEQGQKEASKDYIDSQQKRLAERKEETKKIGERLERLKLTLSELKGKLKIPEPFESTEEYAGLKTQLDKCLSIKENAKNDVERDLSVINDKIEALNNDMQELQNKKLLIRQTEIQRRRINELIAQEKSLSAQYETLEKGIYLCDLFTKSKVAMLTSRINGKFRNVRFRLFQEQINGGVKDDCEVMIPSENGGMIPYTFANNAARINAGLEIIEVLSGYWGVSMPIFIDNAESITRIYDLNSQVIRLIVSETDKSLRLVRSK